MAVTNHHHVVAPYEHNQPINKRTLIAWRCAGPITSF